ncbi:regulator of G-protein signaling protein-like isoform X3 [Hyperolius riggenbachi]|uniref:regulator of G-protein signaling protein-like isoform X3 n=1 Tax=Hyperolius riggenbachi TaxID=752182 RepID=UPI0035A2886E
MDRPDATSSSYLQNLLDDEIFTDFFNTFLNLPIFGQTPCYSPVFRQWNLWPPLPPNKLAGMCTVDFAGDRALPTQRDTSPVYQSFIDWLQKHRLQLFHHTNLYLHFLLCQQLLKNLGDERVCKDPENVYTKSHNTSDCGRQEREDEGAEDSLLRCVIGTVCGILSFRKFLCGTAGGELTSFWLITEKILRLDEHNEAETDQYYSLYRILKATHLSPGSAVLETCSLNSESVLQLMSWHLPGARRDVLKQMQIEALLKLQHYWVPAYISHCCSSLSKLPKGTAMLETDKHMDLAKKLRVQPTPSIAPQKGASKHYSSKVNKKQMWHAITSVQDDLCPTSSRRNMTKQKHLQNDKNRSIQLIGCNQKLVSPERLPKTTFINPRDRKGQFNTASLYPEILFSPLPQHQTPVTDSFPPTEIPEAEQVSSDWLHWALKAEAHAGHPFHSFLITKGESIAAQLLMLWQDLANLLSALLSDRNLNLCVLLTERFFHHCALEVKDDSTRIHSTHIGAVTMEHLMEWLPCREAVPWVLQAQHDLCQSLSSLYEAFLDEEDKIFLQFMTFSISDSDLKTTTRVPVPAEDGSECIAHWLRMALTLAQACSPCGNVGELDLESLNLLLKDLSHVSFHQPPAPLLPVYRKDYSKMSFEELALWNPKMAVDNLSKQFQVYSKDKTALVSRHSCVFQSRRQPYQSVRFHKGDLLCIRKGDVLLTKPSARPRTLHKVLHDAAHLEFFRHYLKSHHAEEPLNFWLMVEKMAAMSDQKQQQGFIQRILKRFFQSQRNPEELLQCDAAIIKEIPRMELLSANTLKSAQSFIFKSLDEKWFKGYQATFPEVLSPILLPKRKKSNIRQEKLDRAWNILIWFIRCSARFFQSMKDTKTRQDFERFLQKEAYNDLENLPSSRHSGTTSSPRNGLSFMLEESTVLHPRLRFVINRTIIVNYLNNDLSFCMEVLRFFRMCDATIALASHGMNGLNDESILRSKVRIIVKLFLASDAPPKLRINISESQRDLIQGMVARGAADRSVFHPAFLTVFPTIIFFWKRFCTIRAMCGFQSTMTQRSTSKSDSSLTNLTKEGYVRRGSSADDCPVLKFSLSKGIQLLMPNEPGRHKAGFLFLSDPADHVTMETELSTNQRLADSSKRVSG